MLMNKLFPNFDIDLEKGTVYSKKRKIYNTNIQKSGYHSCKIYDSFNNKYKYIHEVIMAEGLQLPKHLWSVDENGDRFIVDHIIPVSNGGTDKFDNLHLIPKSDNNKNPNTIINYSKAQKKRYKTSEGYWTNKKRPDISEMMKNRNIGKATSEKTKKKLSESLKNHPLKSKQVYQYSLNGELIAVYPSVSEAVRQNGFNNGCISACCRGEAKTYKGYKWSYEPL